MLCYCTYLLNIYALHIVYSWTRGVLGLSYLKLRLMENLSYFLWTKYAFFVIGLLQSLHRVLQERNKMRSKFTVESTERVWFSSPRFSCVFAKVSYWTILMELYIKESWNKVDYFSKKYLVIDVSSFRAHAIAVHCVQGPLVNSELERGVVKGGGGVLYSKMLRITVFL